MAALKPLRFRVQNFRNIDDSGWIELAQVTCLVGRNESGKTALLKALHKFNPATPQPYSPQREFPRDRFTAEFKNGGDWPACSVEFSVADTSLRKRLQEIVGTAKPTTNVTFTRYYDGTLTWTAISPPLPAETLTYADVAKAIAHFRSATMKLAPPTPEQESTYTTIRSDLLNWSTEWTRKWSGNAQLKQKTARVQLEQLVAESNSKARAETADIITPFQSELSRLTELAAQEPVSHQVYKRCELKATSIILFR